MLESFKKELAEKGVCTFYVKAHPGASASKIRSMLADESVKIDIAAPAEHGKANQELIHLLSEEFGVDKSTITIVSGATARHKLIRITS